MAGTPHRFDERVQDEYLALLRRGVRRYAAARQLGVNPSTVWLARKRDGGFDEACIMAERESVEAVEDVLYEKALAGEPWAVQMVLKNRDRERWAVADRVAVAVSGKVEVEVEAGERLAEIERLRRELEQRKAAELGAGGGLPVVDAESWED